MIFGITFTMGLTREIAVNAHLAIRINFDSSGTMIGPGMLELLERIECHGSIRKAAKSMDMSYRKACDLIEEMQHNFGGSVLTTEIGGSKLTGLGHQLLKAYRSVQKNIGRATATDVGLLSDLVRKGTHPKFVKKGVTGNLPSRRRNSGRP